MSFYRPLFWAEPSLRDPGRFDIVTGILRLEDGDTLDLRFIVDETGILYFDSDRPLP